MRVALVGGAYQSRSLLASAQQAVNVYPESNPPESQAPVPVTQFLTPGLTLLGPSPNIEGCRATYTATNGDLYVCVGPQVYYVNASWQFTLLGTIADASTPVSMSDNGIVVVLVDGSKNGYCIDITPQSISGVAIPRTWGQITDPNFLGSNFVDYIDTFFVFNKPGTYNLYISLSEVSFQMLTQTSVGTGTISDAGSGYTLGTYFGVTLTGGTGTGATADITVQSSIASGGTITAAGTNYVNGSYSAVPLTGGAGSGATADIDVSITTGSITNAGTGYTNGSYASVLLTGGTGTGMMAAVVVAGGNVTSVTINTNGINYVSGDVLSCGGIGAGGGFTWTVGTVGGQVTSLAIVNGGSGYIIGDVLSVAGGSLGSTGSGLQWTIDALTGAVTGVTIDTGGKGYLVGDVLSAATADIGGTGTGFTWTLDTFAAAFDPLDIAAKSGSADPIQRVTVVFRTVWPIGTKTTEAWIDTGAADFALQPLPGVFIEHGCIAPFSVANFDRSSFWLSQDRQGRAVVVMTQGYNVVEVSTNAIVTIFQGYPVITDAIGFTFQQNGHVFYVITFPTANATWLLDIKTKQWSRWAYMDNNGELNRHRANCGCFAYGTNVVGDWQNGSLYALDYQNYTDNGQPIKRIRSFPHLIQDGSRVIYKSFIADIQVGTSTTAVSADPDQVFLRWSDDRGATFGSPVAQSIGGQGEFLISVKWNKLGMARDRVFELSWSCAANISLNGCFIEHEKLRT